MKNKKIDYLILGPQILDLATQGLTAKEIATHLNVGRDAIDRFAKKENLILRDGRGAAYRKETFPCVICGTFFHAKRAVYEAGSKTTCSKACSSIVKSQASPRYAKIKKQCIVCNETFLIKPSREKNSHCCSKECRILSGRLSFKNPELLQQYRDFLKEGKTLEQIGEIVGRAVPSVCRAMNNYDIGHAYNRGSKSVQQTIVLDMISNILNEPNLGASRYTGYDAVSDGEFSIGYIEYDGRGGHYRPDQILNDIKKNAMILPKPIIRVTPQAFYGKDAYLRMYLQNIKSGYVKAGIDQYRVLIAQNTDLQLARQLLRDCHPLSIGSGKLIFVIKHEDLIIGAAQWGVPTDRNETGLELRRFFVLDGTPKNTESWFLSKCTDILPALGHAKLITYCHEWEKGSYLTATGWTEIERKHEEYDFYVLHGKVFSRRVWWKWAKEVGLVEQIGTTAAKLALAEILGAKVIYEGTKRKFVKNL